MTDKCFDAQMERLRNQWPGAYGDERALIIHDTFRTESDRVWTDAVTDVLSNCRAAPLMPELEKAVGQARQREKEAGQNRGNTSLTGVLDSAAGKRPRSEYVKACVDALDWKVRQGIEHTSREWLDIMSYLDRLMYGARATTARVLQWKDRAAGEKEERE